MKVVILSRYFPAYHPRKGEPTNFVKSYKAGGKIHTIRSNAKGYYKDGEMVSLRYWSGKPYCSKQVEIGQTRIGIESVSIKSGVCPVLFTNGYQRPLPQLAENDGLSFGNFLDWFFPPNKPYCDFLGDILHFTDFRYGGE